MKSLVIVDIVLGLLTFLQCFFTFCFFKIIVFVSNWLQCNYNSDTFSVAPSIISQNWTNALFHNNTWIWIYWKHRHLRIYRLLNRAYPWNAGASSGHTTNLKKSILRFSISMTQKRVFDKVLELLFSSLGSKPWFGKFFAILSQRPFFPEVIIFEK